VYLAFFERSILIELSCVKVLSLVSNSRLLVKLVPVEVWATKSVSYV
jgi:hypothetical protein